MKKLIWGIAIVACATGFTPVVSAQTSTLVVSRMGGKCLDVEGGTAKGKNVIGYPCTGSSNQLFAFYSDGTIRQGGYCVDVYGGLNTDGTQLILWTCLKGTDGRPQPNQRWSTDSYNRLIGGAGKCVDLKGGSGAWVLNGVWNQAAIIWPCKVADNQTWYRGEVLPAVQVRGTPTAYAALSTLKPLANVVAAGAGNLIGQDGTSIVAGGGGNIVANDGATIVAAGGGNVLVVTSLVKP